MVNREVSRRRCYSNGIEGVWKAFWGIISNKTTFWSVKREIKAQKRFVTVQNRLVYHA